jgi:hypothetical protein
MPAMQNSSVLNDFFNKISNGISHDQQDWNDYQKVIFEYGLGMEETLQFIHFNKPSFDHFIDWVNENKSNHKIIDDAETEPVLTEADLEFWDANGYIILKEAISTEDCKNTVNAILEYLGATLDNPASWYKEHENLEGLMLLFTKHATLEKNRQSVKIKKAYEQLYQTKDIYKTIDKVSFNPPENETFTFMGSSLHWDTSLALPIPFSLQGLLYLNDVSENAGAFHCVAGFHKKIESWLINLPDNVDPRKAAVAQLQPIPIAGNAGDFIIWHQALPHCASANKSHFPRFVQYLTYLPADIITDNRPWL